MKEWLVFYIPKPGQPYNLSPDIVYITVVEADSADAAAYIVGVEKFKDQCRILKVTEAEPFFE